MKQIPLYKFYKRKYGQELLIDVLDLDYIKKGIRLNPIHRETFYCIILITKGNEEVSLNEHHRTVSPGEVICSRPGEIWKWQPDPQLKGIVLIFEEQFLLSFSRTPCFWTALPISVPTVLLRFSSWTRNCRNGCTTCSC